eukprot:593791-Hanusia_phi.AAC.1
MTYSCIPLSSTSSIASPSCLVVYFFPVAVSPLHHLPSIITPNVLLSPPLFRLSSLHDALSVSVSVSSPPPLLLSFPMSLRFLPSVASQTSGPDVAARSSACLTRQPYPPRIMNPCEYPTLSR